MKRIIMCAVLAFAAAPLSGQVVQLKSGDTLVGVVEDAHEDGLVVRRLDNGGTLDLRWDQLSQESAGTIRTRFGLVTEDEGEMLVRAERIRFELAGGGSDEVVGMVVATDPSTITMLRRGMQFPIPRQQIRGRTTVEVPALDVYTRDGLYDRLLSEHDPGDDADKHILLADALTQVRDYERAAQHLQQAVELGGGRQQNTLDGRIQRLVLFQSAADERELLDRIRAELARKDFAKGSELVQEFEDTYPSGKLRTEFVSTRKRFEKARQRHLTTKLVDTWHKTAYALARAQAIDDEVSYDAAREYAENQMGQDIRARAVKVLRVGTDEVEELWAGRLELRGVARTERYSYGEGSWLLGAGAILRGTEHAKRVGEGKSNESRELDRIASRVQRARERTQRAQRASGGGQTERDTPQDWWEDASTEQRLVWLRAYYAENSGDLEVQSAHVNKCVTCGGEGTLTQYATSGEAEKVECPTCRATRYKRYIRAR